uniref:Uncharacterized protein n=1 Tax=Salix viminalis TaxID=40686 RepID=A0A6N2KPV3_SALVM
MGEFNAIGPGANGAEYLDRCPVYPKTRKGDGSNVNYEFFCSSFSDFQLALVLLELLSCLVVTVSTVLRSMSLDAVMGTPFLIAVYLSAMKW